jgi:hypothetical protein
VGAFEVVREYTGGPMQGVFTTQSLAEKLVMENAKGMAAFLAGTTETTITEASAETEGLFDALYNPATTHLPPYKPDARILGSIAYGIRMRLLEVFGVGGAPPDNTPSSRDPIETLAILGDPALHLKLQAP